MRGLHDGRRRWMAQLGLRRRQIDLEDESENESAIEQRNCGDDHFARGGIRASRPFCPTASAGARRGLHQFHMAQRGISSAARDVEKYKNQTYDIQEARSDKIIVRILS